jgi:hypothetical protein
LEKKITWNKFPCSVVQPFKWINITKLERKREKDEEFLMEKTNETSKKKISKF